LAKAWSLGIMLSKTLPNSTSCFCKSITEVGRFNHQSAIR
jgi:hypothetical protein